VADLVVEFIAPTVRLLLSETADEMEMEFEEELTRIRTADWLPQQQLVGHGFIPLIGWRSRGYHLVPIE
jgi:hypothetical protein